MKVLMINGSPHQEGCTNFALNIVANELREHQIDSEIIQIGKDAVRGCNACGVCRKKPGRCTYDDIANRVIEKLIESDALIVGAPVYFASANASLIAVLDRVFYAANPLFALKPGAALVCARRGGASASLDELWKYFTISQMPIVSSTYWPMIHGNSVEEAKQDLEGVQVMRVLGRNMAWMLQSLKAAREAGVVQPEKTERIHTNFIR